MGSLFSVPKGPYSECRYHLRADSHERTDERREHANGFKSKVLATRVGKLTPAIPQVRGLPGGSEPFYPKALVRSERALAAAVAQSYLQGVSTRRMLKIEENVAQGLTVFSLPAEHRQRLRAKNVNERVNLEMRRRTRVATFFPNEASLLRLVSALLSEMSDDWEFGRGYLTMEAR
ncbi:MAG: transposase [Planctomycetes bacterium]|nr:transposase [Planctomycetota bacterium]